MKRALLLHSLAVAALGCKAPAYVTVSVVSDGGGAVFQLQLTANDGLSSTTTLAPATPAATALVFPQSYVIAAPTTAAVVQADVAGLDQAGVVIARGTNQLAPLPTGGFPQNLTVTLTPACVTDQACDPDAVCAGRAICALDDAGGSGRCIAVDDGGPRSDGTQCGPLGFCDAGVCLGAFCGDGVLQVDAGEQCDDGALNSNTLPFGCRTSCLLYACGDGVVDQGPGVDGGLFGERCDLGALNGLGQGCNSTCTLTGATTLTAGFPDYPGWIDGPVFDNGGGALFFKPWGLAVAEGLLFVADFSNSSIRAISFDAGVVYTLAGAPSGAPQTLDGYGSDAGFYLPTALAVVSPRTLLVGEAGAVRSVDLSSSYVSTLAGKPCSGADFNTCIGNGAGSYDAGASAVSFTNLTGFAFDPFADVLYATEASFSTGASGLRLLSLDDWTAAVAQISGGPQNPGGIAILDGGALFVLDQQTNLVWQLDLDAGTAVDLSSQLAPLPGLAAAGIAFTGFGFAQGLCTDGTSLFVPDTGNSSVWQIDPATLAVSLVAGAGSATLATTTFGIGVNARFEGPLGCAFDAATGSLYVSDGSANVIFQIR